MGRFRSNGSGGPSEADLALMASSLKELAELCAPPPEPQVPDHDADHLSGEPEFEPHVQPWDGHVEHDGDALGVDAAADVSHHEMLTDETPEWQLRAERGVAAQSGGPTEPLAVTPATVDEIVQEGVSEIGEVADPDPRALDERDRFSLLSLLRRMSSRR